MRLEFEAFDGRGRNYKPIIDRDTGNEVGYVRSHGVGLYSSGGIDVSLFGGKYEMTVSRFEACVGFIRGVEAVLNHMMSAEYPAVESRRSKVA